VRPGKRTVGVAPRKESSEEITSIPLDKMKVCLELVRTERTKNDRYPDVLRAEYREFITLFKCNILGRIEGLG
jgi:hypothetical protein